MIEINFHPFPVLKTGQLLLREMTPDDTEDLYHMRSDERVLTYLDFHKIADMAAARTYVQKMIDGRINNHFINWVICRPNDMKLMGTVVFWNISAKNHRAEIGYMMASNHHGRGYMREALNAVLDYGFQKLGLHSVEAVVNPANQPSIKLLEHLQFSKEAHFRDAVFWKGEYIDSAVYSLIRT